MFTITTKMGGHEMIQLVFSWSFCSTSFFHSLFSPSSYSSSPKFSTFHLRSLISLSHFPQIFLISLLVFIFFKKAASFRSWSFTNRGPQLPGSSTAGTFRPGASPPPSPFNSPAVILFSILNWWVWFFLKLNFGPLRYFSLFFTFFSLFLALLLPDFPLFTPTTHPPPGY